MQSCVATAYRERAPGVDLFHEEDIITGIRAFERLHNLAPSAVSPTIAEIVAPPRLADLSMEDAVSPAPPPATPPSSGAQEHPAPPPTDTGGGGLISQLSSDSEQAPESEPTVVTTIIGDPAPDELAELDELAHDSPPTMPLLSDSKASPEHVLPKPTDIESNSDAREVPEPEAMAIDSSVSSSSDSSSSDSPADPPPPLPHTYVVAIRARSKVRTLHLVGSCWRRPGVDYASYVSYGATLPDPSTYHAACGNCFRKQVVKHIELDGNESASTGSSSSEAPAGGSGGPAL